MPWSRCVPILALVGALTAPTEALGGTTPDASPQPPCEGSAGHYEISRATSPIGVDGVLDEPAWSSALSFGLPCEWNPGENVAPPVTTRFLATYDDENLYVAWRAFDPEPAAIRAHLMDRDSIDTLVQDDHVVLIIDTFNDERRGFQFRINPLGVQADAIFSQTEGIEDWSYDMIWESAGRISDEGYVVEAAIPFNQIRFPRVSGEQTWGFDVGRSYPRSVRHRIANTPRRRGDNCLLCQVDKVSGFEDLEPGKNLQVTPTVTALRSDARSRFPDGELEGGDEDVEPGVTARWGVTPNVSLSATLNPDFSQVEADAAQLEVNERFALFFPEKRPFFLEGVDVFATPIQAVFTRTVVDPRWGVKASGKQGANAFGVFVTEDDVNNITVPSNQRTAFAQLAGGVSGSVVRYRRDLGRDSTLGVLYAGREGDDYHNRVFGADAFFRFGRSDSLSVQALGSRTRYPDELGPALRAGLEDDSGRAFLVDWDHDTRNWYWSLSYRDLDRSFRADSGFVPRVDVREASAVGNRVFWGEPGALVNRTQVGFFTRRTEDHSGQLTDENLRVFANAAGPYQSWAEVGLDRRQQYFDGILHQDLWSGWIYLEGQPTGAVKASLLARLGDTVDFQNNRPADEVQLLPGVELKIGRHLNLQGNHTYRRLEVDGGELFTANLSELRTVYNFNVRAFVRVIVQYLDLVQDPSLFAGPVEPEVQDLFTQLLFAYKLDSQTVLFLGYTDSRLGLEDVSLTQTGRSFFVKVGYAWTL